MNFPKVLSRTLADNVRLQNNSKEHFEKFRLKYPEWQKQLLEEPSKFFALRGFEMTEETTTRSGYLNIEWKDYDVTERYKIQDRAPFVRERALIRLLLRGYELVGEIAKEDYLQIAWYFDDNSRTNDLQGMSLLFQQDNL